MQVDLETPEWDPDDVEKSAEDILARNEFQPRPRSLLERFSEWLTEQLAELFSRFGGSGAPNLIAYTLMAVFAVVVLWLLWKLIRDRFIRLPEKAEKPEPTIEIEAPLSARELRSEVERFERDGNWKEAVRARYRLLVSELVERGTLEDIAGRTPGEYRRAMFRDHPENAESFAAVTDVFERIWYGDEPATSEDSALIRTASDRILGAVAA